MEHDHPYPHMSGPQWMWMPTDPPTWGRLLAWHPQPVPLTLIATGVVAALYLAGDITMRRRGLKWPISRTLWFMVGIASIVVMVGTGINGYSMAMFSVHMAQHMTLSMFSPIFLLVGRPATLALRALPSRSGVRRAIVWLLHSKLAAVFSSPLYTIPVYVFSLYGLYFTPVFDALMNNWFGHEFMIFHFVAIGMLLYWPILGLDPSPHTPSHALGFVLSLVPQPFHAFFAVAIMGSRSLLSQIFAHPLPGWPVDPIADQQLGGGIAWGIAEIPNLIITLIIGVLWFHESRREAKRFDRSEERSGDAQLEAYNQWLASINKR